MNELILLRYLSQVPSIELLNQSFGQLKNIILSINQLRSGICWSKQRDCEFFKLKHWIRDLNCIKSAILSVKIISKLFKQWWI